MLLVQRETAAGGPRPPASTAAACRRPWASRRQPRPPLARTPSPLGVLRARAGSAGSTCLQQVLGRYGAPRSEKRAGCEQGFLLSLCRAGGGVGGQTVCDGNRRAQRTSVQARGQRREQQQLHGGSVVLERPDAPISLPEVPGALVGYRWRASDARCTAEFSAQPTCRLPPPPPGRSSARAHHSWMAYYKASCATPQCSEALQ